jgi:16S rRNA (adenine1518-N6/adenine1519-N6)-dimethyltransferase
VGLNQRDHLLPIACASRFQRGAAINASPLDVRALLKLHHLDPRKGLGQNFLVEHGALKKIVNSADVTRQDSVLEIGAGLGSLTRLLAVQAAEVVAVEIDHRLVPVLKEVVAAYPNVSVIEGDILKLDPGQLVGREGYVVVANIPYYITSAIIRHLLENPLKPARLVLTMQREVAERICAEPGELSLLALSVQVYGTPRITGIIPAEAFHPAPKVDSATLRVDLHPHPLFNHRQRGQFFTLIRAGFSQKRKMLRNTLAAGLHISADEASAYLRDAGIDPGRRAQTLSLVEWKTLVDSMRDVLPEEKTAG